MHQLFDFEFNFLFEWLRILSCHAQAAVEQFHHSWKKQREAMVQEDNIYSMEMLHKWEVTIYLVKNVCFPVHVPEPVPVPCLCMYI